VKGAGPVDLVWTTGASSNQLASFTRFIIFDKRRTGLSDRPDQLATSVLGARRPLN